MCGCVDVGVDVGVHACVCLLGGGGGCAGMFRVEGWREDVQCDSKGGRD